MFLFRKNKKEKDNLLNDNIPKHIAIIMDGNGRWAKARNLPRTMGHRAGVETIRRIVKECNRIGVKYLTLYAFSTENWKRPKDEVNALMKLLLEYLKQEVEELHKNNVVVNHIGDISKLPEACQEELIKAYEKTKNNTGVVLSLALNYGGRDEIIHAVKNMIGQYKEGKIDINDISEESFSNYLYTTGIPDPDLVIRPSGEKRISNFLLWQSAYSEFWYSSIYWPDFTEEDLHQAIKDYQNRDRRFGGVK
ncbi:MAG: isoprenyl transferase [Clostridiales bacterium]|uniref:isoprenyl transferase n=1 Tax=Clostridium sp. N3C TaxID=1776758 RepID=UPI00092E0680|nr:isoprenyl transferase [Clostridium sp. N3C]NLZ48194.1 isoprenyl transferase [Clostridiales bacterium]SCN21929.1 Ditrans,polycis-undecaprenyl-diphosphate synthase ((2E,6E)-farnesyl-diphosphate specific) [Clostridium sp. N3C]